MFKVVNEKTNQELTVYAVREKNSVIEFLFSNYDGRYNVWYWDEADNYRPV